MIIPISSVQMRGCAHFEGASQSRVFVSEDLNATQCVFLSFLAQEEEPTTRFLQTNLDPSSRVTEFRTTTFALFSIICLYFLFAGCIIQPFTKGLVALCFQRINIQFAGSSLHSPSHPSPLSSADYHWRSIAPRHRHGLWCLPLTSSG